MNAPNAVVTVLAILAMIPVAAADSITIDPDAFAPETVLNNAFPNVVLTAEGDNLVNANVLALDSQWTSTGSRVFGHTSPGYFPEDRLQWGNGFGNRLRVDFAVGAISVSLDFIADDSDDDNALLRAFDAQGGLIDTAISTGTYCEGEIVTLTVAGPHIAYVEAAPDPGGGAAWRLDHLVYDPVPEPATLCLLAVGAWLCLPGPRRRMPLTRRSTRPPAPGARR